MKSTSNLSTFVLSQTKKFEIKPAFILKEANGFRRPLSFKEFNDTVLKISYIFRKKFPRGGFKVGVWGENRIEWCAVALGAWHAGGTLVPLMHIATDQEIKTIIDRAELDYLFISPKLNKTQSFKADQVFGLDFRTRKDRRSLQTLGDLLQQTAYISLPKADDVFTKPDDIAILIFTSGTTGLPKGVMLSHRNIITNVLDVIDIVPGDSSYRVVSILPLSHMFELVGGFIVAHMKGACISYPESIKPEDIVKELNLHKATMMAAVPLFFEILDRGISDQIRALPKYLQATLNGFRKIVLKYPGLGKIFFKKIHNVFGGEIKYFMSGGAKLDPEIIQRFKSVGILMYQGYGLTETSPVISFTSPNQDKYGSVGKTVHSLQIKIYEPINGEGEICVKGPSVFKGYFKDDEATRAVIEDGWFHTGDVGLVDEEGFIFVTGRKKDMIVTANGKNIYPEEVEYYLKNSPHFAEICVLGVDTGRGESVHAVINTKLSIEDTWKEIERLSGNLSDYKKIQDITVTEQELPKTPTKKIKKHEIKKMLLEGSLGKKNETSMSEHKTPLNLDNSIEAWVAERVSLITKRSDIWLEASLKHDVGIDSLTFMELISAMETQWGTHIEDKDFDKIQTVKDVIQACGSSAKVTALKETEIKPTKFNYKTNNSFFMNFFRVAFNILFVRPLLKVFFRLEIKNQQELLVQNNYLITPNHSSHLDLLSIFASLPLKKLNNTYAVAADDYFFNHPIKAFLVRLLFNAVPFKRKARVDESFRICEEILKDGGNLVIFPEGTRSPDGHLADFKPGVGRLLSGKSYLAIPVYIHGAFQAYPKGAAFPRYAKITVYCGRGRRFLDYTLNDKQAYIAIAKEIETEVKKIRPASQSSSIAHY